VRKKEESKEKTRRKGSRARKRQLRGMYTEYWGGRKSQSVEEGR